MFSKLLKYEWRANSNLLSLLSLAALVAGALGGALLRVMEYINNSAMDTAFQAVGTAGLVIMFLFIIFALIAYVIAVQFIPLAHFYKNKFTDEGYLTFTLPVSVHQIFLSSFLNLLVWSVISVAVVIIAIGLMLMIGMGEAFGTVIPSLMMGLEIFQEEINSYPGYGLYQVLTWLQIILSPIYNTVFIMSCLTVGSVLAKKHKVLASVGIYYAASTVLSIVTSILAAVPSVLLLSAVENYEQKFYTYTNITMLITLGLQLAILVGGYFLSTGLMKRKLNLP